MCSSRGMAVVTFRGEPAGGLLANPPGLRWQEPGRYVISCSPPCHGCEPGWKHPVGEYGGVRIASVTELADPGQIAFRRVHGDAVAPGQLRVCARQAR